VGPRSEEVGACGVTPAVGPALCLADESCKRVAGGTQMIL